MGGGDAVGGVKVGDGLGDFDDFEVAASGKVEPVGGGTQESTSVGGEMNKICDLG